MNTFFEDELNVSTLSPHSSKRTIRITGVGCGGDRKVHFVGSQPEIQQLDELMGLIIDNPRRVEDFMLAAAKIARL